MSAIGGSVIRAWRWLSEQVVQDVPEDIMVCEFDCRKAQCNMDEAELCEMRRTEGVGALSPSGGNERSETYVTLYCLPTSLPPASHIMQFTSETAKSCR